MTDKEIIEITKQSKTMALAARRCGMAYTTFIRKAKALGIYKPSSTIWNKGLTKETDDRLKNAGLKLKGKKPWNKDKRNVYSIETLQRLSLKMKNIAKKRASENKLGKGYKGYYKNIWCESQWELAYVIYCLDHNINIKRNSEYFEYLYNNQSHLYYPDFKVNDIYIEIKGYKRDKDFYKFDQFPKNKTLVVFYYNDLKEIFTYVCKKYNLKNMNYIHTLYTNPITKKENKLKTSDTKSDSKLSKIIARINRIKNYDVDFSKQGWVVKIAKLECISHTSVRRFMKKYMSTFYKNCFTRLKK